MKQKAIDEIVMNSLGEEAFEILEEAAFEYSCLEAEYLKIPKIGKPFKELCCLKRNYTIRELYFIMTKYPQLDWQRVELKISTKRKMLKAIKQKYKGENIK